MGKRRYGFLTDWQRDFLTGLIELESSDKVSVEQRKRIEMREIYKSVSQALEDFRIVQQWMAQSIEISSAMDVLKHFKRWGKMKRDSVVIPLKCPKCRFQFTKAYSVSKEGDLLEAETYGVPRKKPNL